MYQGVKFLSLFLVMVVAFNGLPHVITHQTGVTIVAEKDGPPPTS